jgi:hypothetical protein
MDGVPAGWRPVSLAFRGGMRLNTIWCQFNREKPSLHGSSGLRRSNETSFLPENSMDRNDHFVAGRV